MSEQCAPASILLAIEPSCCLALPRCAGRHESALTAAAGCAQEGEARRAACRGTSPASACLSPLFSCLLSISLLSSVGVTSTRMDAARARLAGCPAARSGGKATVVAADPAPGRWPARGCVPAAKPSPGGNDLHAQSRHSSACVGAVLCFAHGAFVIASISLCSGTKWLPPRRKHTFTGVGAHDCRPVGIPQRHGRDAPV